MCHRLIFAAFNIEPIECMISEDLIVLFKNEVDIESANPNFEQLKKINSRGVIITAESKHYDFVARFFAPRYKIPEDPVTGSAYTQLAPYWAAKLGKKKFKAKQMSLRGGELYCEIFGDRVFISGKAAKYMEGKITI
jgi:PhzF family phenazine biosynthesis protein